MTEEEIEKQVQQANEYMLQSGRLFEVIDGKLNVAKWTEEVVAATKIVENAPNNEIIQGLDTSLSKDVYFGLIDALMLDNRIFGEDEPSDELWKHVMVSRRDFIENTYRYCAALRDYCKALQKRRDENAYAFFLTNPDDAKIMFEMNPADEIRLSADVHDFVKGLEFYQALQLVNQIRDLTCKLAGRPLPVKLDANEYCRIKAEARKRFENHIEEAARRKVASEN